MHIPSYVTNTKLRAWVEEMVALCRPDQLHWCDGSQTEYDLLCEQMVASGAPRNTGACRQNEAQTGLPIFLKSRNGGIVAKNMDK